MVAMRLAITALAVARTAFASCSASATATIQNQGDASAIASCTTFSGSIAIATGTSDSINLDGIQEIDGDLVASNVSLLNTLGANSLETIKGDFKLDTVQLLSSVNFPRLTNVDNIIWNALPNLQTLTFTSSVKKASQVNIQNTQLNSLDGIDLESVDSFYIANNGYLEKIELQLSNISTQLTLEANSVKLAASFPNLEWAFNMTFRNCASVAVPSLKSINGSLGFYSNSFESFEGPNLTTIGGSLSFVSDTQLSNISLPQLTTVNGGFQLANCTELKQVNGFPKLKTVGGALDFYGNMTDIELPSLGDVRGAFNVQSSGDVSDPCNHFKSISGTNSVIKGKFTCVGNQDKPGDSNTTPSSTGSASPKKTGAAGHLDVSSSAVMGFTGVIAAILGML